MYIKFNLEEKRSTFFRNIGTRLWDYTASQPKRPRQEYFKLRGNLKINMR